MKNIALTPEEQLVLAAMKLKPTAEELARMERLVAEVQDWNYCTRLAIDRGIGPLLNHKIPMLGNSHLIPADAQARLQQSYLRTLARSMRLYEAFREVGTALNEAGIKFVALKGVYLAEALYEDIGLRLFSDIDLLVAEEDGERSLEVLREVGYENSKPELYHSDFTREHRDMVHFPPMIKGDVSVEIHVKLHYFNEQASFDIKQMLEDAESVKIANIQAHTLQTDDFIIHLCTHLHKHFRNGHVQFTGYSDVLNLISKKYETEDWEHMLARANNHGCKGVILRQISLMDYYKLIVIPDKFRLDNNLKTKDESLFVFYLRGGRKYVNHNNNLFASLNRFESIFLRIRFLMNVVFPSSNYMISKYNVNKKHLPFYYIKRPIQILFRRKNI